MPPKVNGKTARNPTAVQDLQQSRNALTNLAAKYSGPLEPEETLKHPPQLGANRLRTALPTSTSQGLFANEAVRAIPAQRLKCGQAFPSAIPFEVGSIRRQRGSAPRSSVRGQSPGSKNRNYLTSAKAQYPSGTNNNNEKTSFWN